MKLFNKFLSKSRQDADNETMKVKELETSPNVADENIEDFPLAPVEFNYDIITPKIPHISKKIKVGRTESKSDAVQKPSALELSAKKLLKLQNELKNLTIMQVENPEGDIIPEGIITGKFEIERAIDTKRWLFNLLMNNNTTVAISRVYSSVDAAMNGIQNVIANAKKASIEDQTLKKSEILPFPKWVIYLDNKERFNFILYTSNGNPAIHSHGYSSKTGCKKAIEGVINACKNPMIEKTYLHSK